jgi:hypothetical protein
MPPLFACFPVCLTFVAIALVGVLVVVFGLANRIPGDDQPGTNGAPQAGTGPPPWWVLPLMLLALAALMLVLAWYWPE